MGERPESRRLRVHILNVGYGDCTVVELPGMNHAGMLIDAGDADRAARYLSMLGLKRLYCAVATHPHADHTRGMLGVLERLPADALDCFWYVDHSASPLMVTSYGLRYRALLEDVIARDIPRSSLTAGTLLFVHGTRIDIVSPADEVLRDYSPYVEKMAHSRFFNDTSLVLRLSYRGRGILLGADAMAAAWTYACRRRPEIVKATVFKVSHHGGQHALDEETLAAVSPGCCVVSVGPNGYGCPDSETMAMLERHCPVFRTDAVGDDIVVEVRREGVQVMAGGGGVLWS